MTGPDELPGPDLAPDDLVRLLPDRPVRCYPALLSTEADALAWARAGAPQGAVVVADYQAAPRGRGGLTWEVRAGRDLGFSLVLRPDLPPRREGWLYTVATSALADVAGDTATIHWPDEVRMGEQPFGAVGVRAEPAAVGTAWAVVTALIAAAAPGRGEILARTVAAIEQRLAAPPSQVLDDHRARCATLGRQVTARLVPLGPAGSQITGLAVDTLDDGALVLRTRNDRRIAIRPQSLGELEEAL